MRILVATDGSPCSDAAIDQLLARPWPEPSQLLVVSVADLSLTHAIEPWFTTPEAHESLRGTLVTQAGAAIVAAVDRIKRDAEGRFEIDYELVHGNPARAIVRAADAWDADLIVLGSHGYSGLDRLLLGSVSAAVASHAKCSVEIVRSSKCHT
jgi:nucleotide-binding universal stress UspA family protein